MKRFRLGVPLLLILLFAGSVYYMADSRVRVIGGYNDKLRQAREAVADGVLADGLSLYGEALSVYPSEDVYTEVGNIYLDTGDLTGAQKWYEREFVKQYPNAPQAYAYGIRASLAAQDYREVFAIYDICTKREILSEEIEQLVRPVWYTYELLYGSYDEVGAFSSRNGLAAVRIDDRWSYVNQDGGSEIRGPYQSADVFGDYAAVVGTEGEAYYIDVSGNTKYTASQFKDISGNQAQIKMFRPIINEIALAFDGNTWGYYSIETFKELFGGYEDAALIANGIGAVTKDGQTWALIGTDGQEITGYDYGQVITNSRGILCCTDGLFVMEDGKFWLVDTSGNKISQNAYDTVDAFEEDSWAAVQKNGTWIFVNDSGEEKELGRFEEAKSFSNGLAAVKMNGMWGYIDLEGNQAIDCIFYDAEPFNRTGVAFVKTSETEWNALSLYRYHTD